MAVRLYRRRPTPDAVRRTPEGRVYDGLSRLILQRQAEVERHTAELAQLAQREADMLARLATLADEAVDAVVPLRLEREWLTLSEAAAVTGWSVDTLYRRIRAGRFAAQDVQAPDAPGGLYRIRKIALEPPDRPASDPPASLASSLPPEAGTPAATATAAPASGAAMREAPC